MSRPDFVDRVFWLRFRGDDCIAVNRRLWLLAEGVRAAVTVSQRHYKQDTLVLVTEPATEAPSGQSAFCHSSSIGKVAHMTPPGYIKAELHSQPVRRHNHCEAKGRIGSRGVRFAYGCQHLCHVS